MSVNDPVSPFPKGHQPAAPESQGNFGHSLHSDDADKFFAFAEKYQSQDAPGHEGRMAVAPEAVEADAKSAGLSPDAVKFIVDAVVQHGPQIIGLFSTLLSKLKRNTAVAK